MRYGKAAAPHVTGSDRLQWHPAFSSALKIELADDMDKLTFHTEYQLTRKPMAMDLLIEKADSSYKCSNGIADFFRRRNIVEYKSPTDSYGIRDFYKTVGYAGTYLSGIKEPETSPGNVTITVVCARFPRRLEMLLEKAYGTKFVMPEPGIYRAETEKSKLRVPFPIQFVINTELDPDRYIWLSRLKCDLTVEDDVEVLAREYRGKQKDALYETVMDVIMRANHGVYKEAKDMCKAFEDLFPEEFQAEREKGIETGRQECNKLSGILLDNGMLDELRRSLVDSEYQQMLLKQYGI